MKNLGFSAFYPTSEMPFICNGIFVFVLILDALLQWGLEGFLVSKYFLLVFMYMYVHSFSSLSPPIRKQEDNNVYQKALNQIKCVIKPLVAGVDLDEEDVSMKDITREEIKLKQEPIENGTVD